MSSIGLLTSPVGSRVTAQALRYSARGLVCETYACTNGDY